ncbi:MAG: helix-turn-helix domain-containing protein [Faecousia sp.]
MSLGEKLAMLRRQSNYTQEQLAELLGVSRQAVSKWESDTAYPETEKLIRLAKLYDCSLDNLLLDKASEPPEEAATQKITLNLCAIGYERVSKRKIGNLPLWHINIGCGRVARGVFAFGLVSRGIFSIGMVSLGVVSFGVLGIGLLGMGAFALGLVAAGAVSAGLLAVGAVAFGIFSLGACAVGQFAVGAAAVGRYAAMGDSARAAVAIGESEAKGVLFETVSKLTAADIRTVGSLLEETTPWYLTIFRKLFLLFVK